MNKIFKAQVDVPGGSYDVGDTIPVQMENIKFFSEKEELLSSLYITVETESINAKVIGADANE